MTTNVSEVQHFNAKGKLISTSQRATTIGQVRVQFTNTDHFEGTYEGKGLYEYEFRGKVFFKNTNFIDWFEGLVTADDNYVMKVKKGTMHFKDKATYEGEFHDGKRHGSGVYRWSANEHYEGTWKDGHQVEGTHYYPSGNKYTGQFNAAAKKHGRGTFFFPSGEQRGGKWVDDFLITGWNRYANGNYFEGEFRGDSAANRKKGVFYYRDPNDTAYGGRYDGEFDAVGKIEGQGTWYFLNGDALTGNWVNATLTVGEIRYANGDTFQGKIDGHRTRRRVEGTWKLRSGDVYTGGFMNDLPDGKGIYRDANGDVFEGFFTKGQRSGVGKVMKKDGAVIYGEWTNGVFSDGKGEKDEEDYVPVAVAVVVDGSGFDKDIPYAGTI